MIGDLVAVPEELLIKLRDFMEGEIRRQDAGTEGVSVDLLNLHVEVSGLLPDPCTCCKRFPCICIFNHPNIPCK